MRLKLKLLDGENIDYKVKENDVVTIGRSPKCSIVIPKDGMSRQHCQLEIVNGEVFITDLGSTNGVFIDGVRIQPNTRTLYLSYLTLAFGAVQNLQVDAEDNSVPDYSVLNAKPSLQTRADPAEVTTGHQLKSKPQKQAQEEKTRPQTSAPKKKKDNGQFWIMNGLIIVLLGGLAYWYLNSDMNADTPDFESIPDEPAGTSKGP